MTITKNDLTNVMKGYNKNINTKLDSKVDKVSGKTLSTNDYTDQEKSKLANIKEEATKTANSSTNGNIIINDKEENVYTHPSTHEAGMITGLSNVAKSGNYNDLLNKPGSLPANGGNADTVDGLHANQLGTLSSSGTSHGTAYPLMCQHNRDSDGLFKLYVEGHKTKTDQSTNSDTVDGLHGSQLARQYVTVNSANISDTNAKEFYGTCVTSNSSAPNTDWWHIINVPHSDNNGYGAQLALGYHGNAGLHVRSAAGTSWGAWYDVIGNIENAKSLGMSYGDYFGRGLDVLNYSVSGKTIYSGETITVANWSGAGIFKVTTNTGSYNGGPMTVKVLADGQRITHTNVDIPYMSSLVIEITATGNTVTNLTYTISGIRYYKK